VRRSFHRWPDQSSLAVTWSDAPCSANVAPGRLLPRHVARRQRLRDLPRRRRSPLVSRSNPPLHEALPLDAGRALPADDALPPRSPHDPARALAWAAVAPRPVRTAFQRPPQTLRSALRRTLLGPSNRRCGLPPSCLPLRCRESRARRPRSLRRRVALGAQPVPGAHGVRGRASERRTSRPRCRRKPLAQGRAGGRAPLQVPPRARVVARGRPARA